MKSDYVVGEDRTLRAKEAGRALGMRIDKMIVDSLVTTKWPETLSCQYELKLVEDKDE